MLRMSWRYAPWSTRLVRFQKPVTRTRVPTATPEDDRGEKAEPRRYALLTLIRHFVVECRICFVECIINTNTPVPTATPEDDRGEKAEPRRYAQIFFQGHCKFYFYFLFISQAQAEIFRPIFLASRYHFSKFCIRYCVTAHGTVLQRSRNATSRL